jgi:hypothetical protein
MSGHERCPRKLEESSDPDSVPEPVPVSVPSSRVVFTLTSGMHPGPAEHPTGTRCRSLGGARLPRFSRFGPPWLEFESKLE